MSVGFNPFSSYTGLPTLQPTPQPSPGPVPQPPGQKPSTAGTPSASSAPKTPSAPATPPANPPSQPPGTLAGQLAAGTTLKAGQDIRSANGQYDLKMQQDGNLVLTDLANHKVLWSSGTAGSGAQSATMQTDGNLVVVKGTQTVWSSKTTGSPGASLMLQNDGNAVIHKASAKDDKKPPASVWSSGTAAFTVDTPDPGTTPTTQAQPPATVGLFKPGLPPLGEQQYTITDGESAWSVLQKNHVFDGKDLVDATPLLDANLAATPYLDRQPFGNRPANPTNAVYYITDGKTVTVLDSTRLGMLEQERQQLNTAEHETDPTKKTADEQQLAATIYTELDYAGTQQAVPDLASLANSIKQRAPNDPTLSTAVDAAVAKYSADLNAQGRTPDQLGAIDKAAAAGNWSQVQSLTQQQIVTFVGKDQGDAAVGDISARGGVYLTYAGGDPKFAKAVEQGIKNAQQQVLIDNPIKAVQDAYNKGGAASAMKTLNQMTDPQTMTPGQVGQIMSDPRIQAVVKKSLGSIQWSDPDSISITNDLSAACQHAVESDQGHPGMGKSAVDQIAADVVAESGSMQNTPQLIGDPSVMFKVLENGSSQGNVSLALAVAAKNDPATQTIALEAARAGIDAFTGSVKSLNSKTAQDAQFLGVPLQDWGGDSTPAEQQAAIQKLLADNPDDAKKLNADGLQEVTLQEQYNSMQMAVAAYSPDLNGVAGFNHDAPRDVTPGAVQATPSVLRALDAVPTFADSAQAGDSTTRNTTVTNTLWFQRSSRNVIYQSLKALLVQDPSSMPASLGKFSLRDKLPDGVKNLLLSPDGKSFNTIIERANKGISGYLFLQNGAFCLDNITTEPHSVANIIEDGTYAAQHGLFGLSQSMAAVLPNSGALATVRPGSGQTPIAAAYERLSSAVDGMSVSDSTKALLKGTAGAVFHDTADLAYFGIDAANAVTYFANAKTPGDYEHAAGETLSVAGDTAFLFGTAGEALGVDTVFGIGMGAVGWTGIGAAVMLAGAGVFTIGSAENHSHAFDSNDQQYLVAIGVKPEVAEQLAKHSFSFDAHAPTAGSFLTQYFHYANAPQSKMVAWLNSLSPQQADAVASALKAGDGQWENQPMQKNAAEFDQALLTAGIMPPIDLIADNQPSGANGPG
ncbi:hypothetical protein [Paraburkholderia flava]|uniref:hypothetical protein n=1 Tax=Paraburkholderia flava TaxID=2547393 RepID=UPI0010609EF0|nr:hypothetical protein [Paraburkholderia flava]